MPTEDSYGLAKRLEFLIAEIEKRAPQRVLDLGCGTGANLTAPLAARFPQIQFTGVDSDTTSIVHARQVHALPNLEFRLDPAEFSFTETFDLIVASEVLEHVEDPDAFLENLRSCLTVDGVLLVTVPNGFGPFEWASLIETLMQLSGLYAVLRALRRSRPPKSTAPQAGADTLAISPHVNFFSFRELRRLFDAHGLVMTRYRARTFLCGFGFDQLLRGGKVLRWNARVADRLPPQIVSDWMFVLEPGRTAGSENFRRGAYARLRRWLNFRRYQNLAPTGSR